MERRGLWGIKDSKGHIYATFKNRSDEVRERDSKKDFKEEAALSRGQIYSINVYSSTLLLACISGDRYIAIVQARRSVRIRSQAQVYSRLICSVIWMLAFILSLPTFIYYQEVNKECITNFEEHNTARLMKILIPSMQMVLGFLVPLMVMIFCYSCTMVTLLKAQNFQKHKAIRVVLAVVFVFVLCHLPYNVALLVYTSKLFNERNCKEEQVTLMTLSISRSVAYLHCCLNPILYAFIGVKFRSHFCQFFRDLRCLGKRYISGRSSQQTSELYISRCTAEENKECILNFEEHNLARIMKILIPSMQMVLGFLVPLMVMIFCYSCTMVTLLKAQNFQKHKAIRVVLAVVFVFVLCHLPYNVALLVYTSKLFNERNCKEEQVTLMTLSISRSVAYLHCCLNPILYAFIGVKFRSHFCQFFRDLRCLGKRYISGRSSQQTSELYKVVKVDSL
ncbi:C-C chemokine receptor type 6-like [Sinocyclocheilus rhinocerous]|uniref:C-C chemokine receptor type 6-like n=1 Tax=Sinocyclocheilus rhinocerous TaxID=307959 RepID=UPI0007B7F259|nr:PREDICTED: C-C chemokine receptor type 6-like [Sinocyclocheilus rhinocerous]